MQTSFNFGGISFYAWHGAQSPTTTQIHKKTDFFNLRFTTAFYIFTLGWSTNVHLEAKSSTSRDGVNMAS
jgi:hypothetical protein